MTLDIIQIVVSIILIVVILLQSQGAGLGSTFGGEGGAYRTKRGAEKILFNITVVLAVIFLVISFLNVVI